MFETVKLKSKRNYYSQKILEYKNNAKNTWNIMKKAIGKANKSGSRLPTKLAINKNDVTSEICIANEFNRFFTNSGAELAGKIRDASRTFGSFLNKINTKTPADPIVINELKEACFSLKTNKSADYDRVSSNFMKNCVSELNYPLKYLFGKSIGKGVFPDALKKSYITF